MNAERAPVPAGLSPAEEADIFMNTWLPSKGSSAHLGPQGWPELPRRGRASKGRNLVPHRFCTAPRSQPWSYSKASPALLVV